MQSTSSLKAQLAELLGTRGLDYWQCLSSFLSGRVAKTEFDDLVNHLIVGPNLISLHNALVMSLLEAGTVVTPPTPPPDGPKQTRKRKRLLPYQGPESSPEGEGSLRSKRLKRWAISIGKLEREKVKQLAVPPTRAGGDAKEGGKDKASSKSERPMKGRDVNMYDRGVRLIWEGRDTPGTHLPLHLSSTTRSQSLQHISERLALISSQNNLSAPSRQVSSLLLLAFESKIKSLIYHAITLTTTSHAISTISPAHDPDGGLYGRSKTLGIEAFRTLLTLAPNELPNGSAAATRMGLAMGDSGMRDADEERHSDDPRWQLLAILRERSGVREVLDGSTL